MTTYMPHGILLSQIAQAAGHLRMAGFDKKGLSERDICTKFITPDLRQAGWDELAQIREEVGFTKCRIIVRGKLVTRGKAKRADYILYSYESVLARSKRMES